MINKKNVQSDSCDSSDSSDFKKQYLSMATKEFSDSFVALLRTRVQVIYISTNEEKRLIDYIHSVSLDRSYDLYEWDCFKRIRKVGSGEDVKTPPEFDLRYPEQILSFVIQELETQQKKKENNNGSIYILCDFYRYLSPDRCNPQIERQIKYINRLKTNSHVILTGPNYINNMALEKEIAVLDFPFPNEQEIKKVLTELTDAEKVKAGIPGISKIIENNQEELINSVKGLTVSEAIQAYSKSIVMANSLGIKPLDIGLILQEKKQIIKKTDILEYVDSNINIEDVGGLDSLVRWMNIRKVSFTKDAMEYGLKPPKGVLLLGLPGCGKSLTSKAAATLYEMPLLRLDFGKMFNSLVGESEKMARHAIKLAETVAPCVSGDSIVYDSEGRSHKIKDLVDFATDKPFYTYSFNEQTWKIEKTKVKAAIKHAKKKHMIRIGTAAGTIDVTKDHKMMVNRDGKFIWVEAKDITNDDVLIMPKKLQRETKKLSINDVFPGKTEKMISMRVGGSLHKADVNFNVVGLMNLAIIAGMIDANGSVNIDNGDIMYAHKNIQMRHFIAAMMSEAFLTEPEVHETFVRLKNVVVAKMIQSFLDNLGSQNEEILGFYLAGIYHSDGFSGFADKNSSSPKKPYVSLPSLTDGTFDRIRKSLLVFGILPFRSTNMCLIADTSHIQSFFSNIPSLTKNQSNKVNKFVQYVIDNPPAALNVIGYKLDSSAICLKDEYKENVDECNKMHFMKHDVANTLNFFFRKAFGEEVVSPVSKLVESDVVGVKVNNIVDVGEQWAYDLSCEKNNNFFANGFLCHNCILWADEIEKGLAGGVGAGSGDSGTTKRVIGTFLTWLQEKTAPVFVICTANNVQDIPPEFMRAGRFDEVFFVDLPSAKGREQIFEVLLRKLKHDVSSFDLEELASCTNGYSGAEIEKAIENAMFECFCQEKRPITTKDIVMSCNSISPLSKTRDKEFAAMREWANGRCKFANTGEDLKKTSKNQTKNSFNLDIG